MPRIDPTGRDEALAAVALVRAALADDIEGQQALLADADPSALLAAAVSLAVTLGVRACGGFAELDAFLAQWQGRMS